MHIKLEEAVIFNKRCLDILLLVCIDTLSHTLLLMKNYAARLRGNKQRDYVINKKNKKDL